MVEYGQVRLTPFPVRATHMAAACPRNIRVVGHRFEADASAGLKTPNQVRSPRDSHEEHRKAARQNSSSRTLHFLLRNRQWAAKQARLPFCRLVESTARIVACQVLSRLGNIQAEREIRFSTRRKRSLDEAARNGAAGAPADHCSSAISSHSCKEYEHAAIPLFSLILR